MIVSNVSDEHIGDKAKKEWFSYWRHFSAGQQKYCSEVNCLEEHTHGVLVKVAGDEEQLYVIPLCKAHSENLDSAIEIAEGTEVIPANLTL